MKGEHHSAGRLERDDLTPPHARAVFVLLIDQSTCTRLEHHASNPASADGVAVRRPPFREILAETAVRLFRRPGHCDRPSYRCYGWLFLRGHHLAPRFFG